MRALMSDRRIEAIVTQTESWGNAKITRSTAQMHTLALLVSGPASSDAFAAVPFVQRLSCIALSTVARGGEHSDLLEVEGQVVLDALRFLTNTNSSGEAR